MRPMMPSVGESHGTKLLKIAVIFFLGCYCVPSMAQQPGQKTFASAEAASHALLTAMQSDDEKAMLGLLGADATQIISSGDETEDAHQPRKFRREISGNAPPGKRAGWHHYVVYRREELAYAHSAGEKRQLVVFRYGVEQEGNLI